MTRNLQFYRTNLPFLPRGFAVHFEVTLNKKLSYSYCRDSAGRRSLHRSWSFKVTDFGTSRKPVCNFLLVNNTNLHHISHFSSYRLYGHIILWQWVPIVNALVLSNFGEYHHKNHISLILWTTFLSQTVLVHLQPLLENIGSQSCRIR